MQKIVLDFDDTLSFTKNRDWENASPNQKLIEKTNKLFDAGWRVEIFTARGSISCTSREEADKKYRKQIEAWLDKHNVKYHQLSFDKPLATYYIDDKGITPEDFINIEIRDLEGGLSGSTIYTDGKTVYKQDENIVNTLNWFKAAKEIGLKVPEINSTVGKTINMEYIDNVNEKFIDEHYYSAIGMILDSVEKMRRSHRLNYEYKFLDYKCRIVEHYQLIDDSEVAKFFDVCDIFDNIKSYLLTASFSHGDFGISNMLFTESREMYLIDPIQHTYTCIELDCAKLCASLVVTKRYSLFNETMRILTQYLHLDRTMFQSLVKCELLRVYKYHPNKEEYFKGIKGVFR